MDLDYYGQHYRGRGCVAASVMLLSGDSEPARLAVGSAQSSSAQSSSAQSGSAQSGSAQSGSAKIGQAVAPKDGERSEFKPEWKPSEPAGETGVVASGPNSNDSDMLVADALPELKRWPTDLDAAKRQAAQDKKDILLVFFGLDNRQWCLQLAADLLVKKEFRKYADARFVLVLLEAPIASSTANGKGAGRAAELAKLAADYAVKSFPTMVLTDARGEAYASDDYKRVTLVDYLQKFSEGLALRKERDKLFAPTETGSDDERVDAARLALEFLEKNDLVALNAARIHHWLELAEKVDSNNERGKCEDFFLAELGMRLREAGNDDPQKMHVAIQALDDWRRRAASSRTAIWPPDFTWA